MDSNDKHKYDGKEDRNYHQKPFDDVTDPLPQIDDDSASKADKGVANNPDSSAGKDNEIYPEDINESSGLKKINEQDKKDLDPSQSRSDWDAENNNSGRRK